ncbi:hypothetical protein [Chryseobacterium shigense]|uniref:TonB protein C-terminal n=1 Tax=Chryseobacterium shigense TaxID=297244 RepID=A0A841NIM0_9FLAO|nr:hypothetical protein [Chryseobacterium shigense]MBB6371892.1 hypothetical protein [Chryseobacterium shigense]
MKTNICYYLVLALFLVCCVSKKKNMAKTEYEPLAGISYPMEEDERKYWDSLCNAEEKKAVQDIKNNNIFYTHVYGMVEMYRSDHEIDSLLALYSIKPRESLYYCTVPVSKQNCYGKRMQEEIVRRHGENFIDSLRKVADISYVKKRKNEIFSFEECDMNSRYAKSNDYSEALDLVEKDFWKTTEYPDEFAFRKEKDLYSSMEANFILQKDGSISEPKVEIRFQNENNYQFSGYFIKKLKDFVKNSKWKPATSVGIPVNSEMNVLIFFK